MAKKGDILLSVTAPVGVMNFAKDDTHSLPLAYSTSDLLDKYDEIVSQSNKLIFEKGMENIQLEELRDWLLPMLMNGQVTVNQ